MCLGFMNGIEQNQLGNEQGDETYRVMIVDDSAFIRGAIARAIEEDSSLVIVSSVSNGEQAIKSLQRSPVDVIVLDIEMPVMDGLTALPHLKAVDDAVQIIMASTLTQKNAEISLKAMSLGATDYIPKPSSGHAVLGALDFKQELILKIKVLGALAQRMGVRPSPSTSKPLLSSPSSRDVKPQVPQPNDASREEVRTRIKARAAERTEARKMELPIQPVPTKKQVVLRTGPIMTPDIIAIGSSTGGPQALFRLVKDLGRDLSQPVVITQHMPAAFTAILADHISRQCEVDCREAKEGDILVPGCYYVAPGDYHMLINTKPAGPTIHLVQDPPENFCRPAVDPMLRSVSAVYGKKTLVVILTGMGQDGMKGSEVVVQSGGAVVAQDEVTSVVWGMPGAVATAGLCSAVLPLAEIGAYVKRAAKRSGV